MVDGKQPAGDSLELTLSAKSCFAKTERTTKQQLAKHAQANPTGEKESSVIETRAMPAVIGSRLSQVPREKLLPKTKVEITTRKNGSAAFTA